MSENVKVLKVAKQGADRVESFAYESNLVFKNKIHLPMKAFDKSELTKITDAMAKQKKDAEFCGSFDGDTVKYFVRIGTVKMYKETEPKGAAKLSAYGVSGVDQRNEILDELVLWGIATKAQADALKAKPIKI